MGMKPEIQKRRFKLIQEDISSNRLRSALSRTNELLNRYPDVIPALVIRAELLLTLQLGMDYQERALDDCIKSMKLMDEKTPVVVDKDTLKTLKSVCRYLKQWDIVTQCYRSACDKSKHDLKLLEGLFECYVHEYSLQNQEEIARKLYKLTLSEVHMLWAICSIQLQVFCTKKPDKLLQTAERLFVTHDADHGVRSRDGLLVYISVLEQRRNYEAAIRILSRLTSENMVLEVTGLRMQGRLLALDKKYTAAAEVFKKLLTTRPDDWECFQHYLSCLLEDDSVWSCGTNNDQIHPLKLVDHKLSKLSDEVFDSCMKTASDFMRGLIPAPDSYNIIRCPHLALVEIERRKFLQGKSDGEALMMVLLDYFHRFGQLACYTLDVESSLQLLTTQETMALVENFKSVPLPRDDVSILARKITLFKLQELFELSLGDLENNAVIMTELFTQSLPLSKNLYLQESMHGEDLLSLATNALVQLFWRTQCPGYLLEAIFILEFGLTVRRYIPQYKILLVHIYSHLGAIKLAYEWYKSLAIEKNLLLETVSHHILPQMLSSPFLGYSMDLLEEYHSFMKDQFVEFADSAIFDYLGFRYSTIFENFLLKDRLQNSHKYLMARLETPILQLKQKANNIEEVELVLQGLDDGRTLLEFSNEKILKSLTVNDDMETRPWWSPTPDMNYLLEPFEKKKFIRPDGVDKNWLWRQETSKKGALIKRKSLLPRLISLSILSASLFIKQDAQGKASLFLNLLVDYAENLGFSLSEAERISTGETSFQEVPSSVHVVDCMCLVVFLTAHKLGSHKDGLPATYWSALDSLFRNFTEEKIMSELHLIAAPGVLLSSFVQMVTEPLAWHCLVLQSCTRLLIPLRKRKKKKGERAELKKKDERAEQLTKAVLNSIESLCGTIELVTEWARGIENRLLEEQKFDTILSLLPNTDGSEGAPGRVFAILRNLSSSLGSPDYGNRILDGLKSWDAAVVVSKVTESQNASLNEFLNILQMKLTLLKKLKKQLP